MKNATQLTPREILARPHVATFSGDGSCLIVEPVKLVPLRGSNHAWWNRRICAYERDRAGA